MNTTKESVMQYVRLVREYADTIRQNSPEAFVELRGRATDALEALPDKGVHSKASYAEASDASMFAPDYGVNITRLGFAVDLAATFRCDVPNLSTLLGVVVNDGFRPTALLEKNLPEGVAVCSLSRLACDEPEYVKSILGSVADNSDVAVNVNTMLLMDGVVVRVNPGVKVEKAIQIVNIFNATAPMLTPRRIIIDAAAGAEVKLLLCDHSQQPEVPHLSSEVIEIIAGEGASVELYGIEESSALTRCIRQIYARQHQDSSLAVSLTTLRGGITRNELHISTAGDRTHTTLSGLSITSGSQTVENHVDMRHNHSHGESNQLFKNALFDASRGSFGGIIRVDEKATFTDARQTNRNLLISADSRMMAAPQLEIYCDEVQCSHGATSGQLDERALFYMRSRGIPEEEARMMLTQAFMSDVIDMIGFDVLRERMHHLVEKRLHGAEADCATCRGLSAACDDKLSN